MSTEDQTMKRIGEAMALQHAGDPGGARRRFSEIWEEIAVDGDPFHRCVLAHHMADLQPDPRDELAWDLRALEAAASVSDDRAKQHDSSLAIRGFYPSLHLNLAADFHKLADTTQARAHLAKAREHFDALNDDDYGRGIRSAVQRLADQLGQEHPTPSPTAGEANQSA
ncbi:hypothetical protein SZN_02327 [Streptomyces zinciresistens K42]|uniref:Tetratricopeptide repeat protein n=1 Tax=Streptomyces zinciresistens K42 TaxID=700597 RepID=G2G4R2_9ACTN|nr:hypothetical protein [Streptomyces zinciresistens]EGX61535.1 hypothetical protein SZN_02327 [Streptomyces zinciresistens K42]